MQVIGSSSMSSMDCRGSICGQKKEKHLNPAVQKELLVISSRSSTDSNLCLLDSFL